MINRKKQKELRTIDQGTHEWIKVRKTRLSSSLIRKAISNTDKILDHVETDEFIGLINVGVVIETLIFNFMPGFLRKTGLWTDPDLPYIVGSPDGICEFNGRQIPVEVKTSKASKSFDRLINEYYYQIQSYIYFLNADRLLLIYYEIEKKKLSFLMVNKDKKFKEKYFPLVERSYWKYLAQKYFKENGIEDYLNHLQREMGGQKLLKYYKGDFNEEKRELVIPTKCIKYKEMKMEDILRTEDMSYLKRMLREYTGKLNLDKLNSLTKLNFYMGRQSYIDQRVGEAEAFIESLKKAIK